MLSIYPACFFREENGFSVIFPDLNTATQGDTMEEAMEMAVDCLASFLHVSQMGGEELPAPSNPAELDPQAILRELDPSASPCEAFVSMVSVDVADYAKKHFEKSVKKTLTIPAWLNKAAMEKNINFSQVLQDALKNQLGVT